MFRVILLLFSGLLFSEVAMCQMDSVMDRLQQIKASDADSTRIRLADEIPFFLEKTEYGKYPQGPSVQFLGYRKCSREEEVELFSWVVPLREGQMFYNWFRFREGNRIYSLKDFSDGEGKKKAWLYYDLIGFKKGKDIYFLLLGWNKTHLTNQKIVQVCSFLPDGTLDFNSPLLRRGNSRSASLCFEYAAEGSMTLKQDKGGKRIIFDHLVPADPKYEGCFAFYGPDASYDALVWKEGEWRYEEEVED